MFKAKKQRSLMFSTGGFLFIILVWAIASVVIDQTIILPTIQETLSALWGLMSVSSTYLSILNTVGGLILVLIAGFVSALILALLSLKWPNFKHYLTPILSLFKITPVPTLIILFLVSYAQGFIPYLLTYLVVLPLIYDGLYGAIISIPKDIIDEIKITSKFNLQILFKVYIPLIENTIITVILQALGLGLKVKVMTEFIAEAPHTIGYALSYARATLSMPVVFAWSALLIMMVIIVDYVLLKRLKDQNNL